MVRIMRHNVCDIITRFFLAFLLALSIAMPLFLYAEEDGEASAKGQVQTEETADPDALPDLDYDDNAFAPPVDEEGYGWRIFQTIIVLGLMMGGFYLFFRFVTKQTAMPSLGSSLVDVLASAPLGPNRYVQLVDVGGVLLVLGVTDNAISLLTEITDRDERDRLRLLASQEEPVRTATFQEFLTRQVGRIGDIIQQKKESSGKNMKLDGDEYTDYSTLLKQKNRLKDLNGDS